MKNSYDKRIVNYEEIHQLTREHFNLFVDAIHPQSGEIILDVGAGYGAATREMMVRNINVPINYYLLEKSKIQLERAQNELRAIDPGEFVGKYVHFKQGALQHHPFEANFFDKVVAKSFIHEIPETEKIMSFTKVYDILKKGGLFVIWNYLLDENNCNFIQNMIRKKDELSGFKELVRDRHFPTKANVISYLNSAGFSDIEERHTFTYTHHSKYRLGEFAHEEDILFEFNQYIDQLVEEGGEELKKHINYRRIDNDILVDIKQSIIIARK